MIIPNTLLWQLYALNLINIPAQVCICREKGFTVCFKDNCITSNEKILTSKNVSAFLKAELQSYGMVGI